MWLPAGGEAVIAPMPCHSARAGVPRGREAPKARMSTMRELGRIFKPASGIAEIEGPTGRAVSRREAFRRNVSTARPQFEKTSRKSQGNSDRPEVEPLAGAS